MASKQFKVDARAVISLGRDSIKDHVTAVVELVKNSYDAGAKVAEIELSVTHADAKKHFIRIADNGDGMNEDDVEKKWLRIGFSEKLADKKIGTRRRLGEKGVGRLSADRLGEKLQLSAQAKDDSPVGIKVNWKDFETAGRDIGAVDIPLLDTVSFKVPQPSAWDANAKVFGPRPEPVANGGEHSGCELKITELRQAWEPEDVARLRDELTQLINPFDGGTDFQIRVITDLEPASLTGVLVSPEMMDGEIEGIFAMTEDEVIVTERVRSERKKKRPVKIPREAFLDSPGKKKDDEQPSPKDIGAVEVRIRLYNIGEGLTAKATKSLVTGFLDQNAGVRVYRDGVRVLPYGDSTKPEGDWLELADRKARLRAGVGRSDWRIEPNRIVGAVIISRDGNPDLHDAAGREGLIANDAFEVLWLFVSNCVRHIELAYHKLRDAPIAAKEAVTQPRKVVRYFQKYVEDLTEDLKTLEKALPKSQKREVEKVRAKIEKQEKKSKELGEGLAEVLNQQLTYRGLATLGIAHASFGHEIQMSAGQFVDAAHAAGYELDPPVDIKNAKKELAKAIKHGERISTWGSYTLTRVNAVKRRPKDEAVGENLEKLIADLVPFFDSSSVELKTGSIETISDKIVPMDLESLVINLLTNAYDFVKDSSRLPRRVQVNLKKKTRDGAAGYEITVGDSGSGVPKHIWDDIWRPLFTTKKGRDGKPSGTGLGLSIVDNIVKEQGGQREVSTDAHLGGALFRIWLPFHSSGE